MPSFSIADASARTPRPDAFSERKSSSMMTIGKRNFIGYLRAAARRKRRWVLGKARIIRARSRRETGISGAWRVLREFDRRNLPLTVFGIAMALERNPEITAAFIERGDEIACHGWRWIDYQNVDEATEREHMRVAIDIIKRMTGAAPLGWYTGRDSPNTRRLVVEHGGFLSDADYYGDDLPFWTEVEVSGGQRTPHLIVPYTLDSNDMRFASPQGFNTGDQFFTYLKD